VVKKAAVYLFVFDAGQHSTGGGFLFAPDIAQVDGEYLGKIKQMKATIIPDALEVIVPAPAG